MWTPPRPVVQFPECNLPNPLLMGIHLPPTLDYDDVTLSIELFII